jgi:nucleotide-binding universal stress UspA family protein
MPPCDVVVAKVGEMEEPTNILLPTAGGRHARLAEDIAAAVAQSTHTRVTLLNVVTDEYDISAGRAFLEKRQSVVANGDVDVTMNLVSGADITQTILDFATSHEFDTVVIGAAGEGIVRRVLFGDIPEEVGERFDGQVLMVKAHRTIQSTIVLWLRK